MNEHPILRTILGRAAHSLRRDAALTLALAAVAALPLVLLLASAVGVIQPWSRPGFGPLLLDFSALAAAALLVYRGIRHWVRTLDEHAVAADVERSAGMPDGAVRGALELSRAVPEGTSAVLARRVETEMGARLAAVPAAQFASGLHTTARRRRSLAAASFASLTLAVVLLAFLAPEHTRAAWSPLAHPVRNLTPPPLPALVVEPGNAAVMRGADLHVRIRAPERAVVTLHWRMQGDVPREAIATVAGDSAAATITRIDGVTEYWVTAPDGASSAHFRVTPSDPLLLSELSVDVIYPAHVGRPTEHFAGEVPPLELPEGTQLIVSGRATRMLRVAELIAADPAHRMRFTIDDHRFSGTFTPRSSGVYPWLLQDRSGGDVALQPTPFEITLVRDGAPQVDITFPANDTILDATLRQSIVADARDDYGLTTATLVSWRVSRSGQRDAEIEQAIDLTGDDRALIRALLDGSERSLIPGDTLKFFVRVTDNSPRRQIAVSRTIALRLPSAVELRAQVGDDAEAMLQHAQELAKTAARLQETTQGLERRTSAANARRQAEQQQARARGESTSQKMDFQEAAPARQLLERQEELLQQMEEMRRNMDAFERALERSGLRDAELQQRMEEMRKLYDELLTPELKQKLEEMRKALEQLDPAALQQALEEMAQQQEQMKEQLERSVELMQRAATEQQMSSLAQEARELATQQQALAEAMKDETQKPTPEQAKQQEELAKRAAELAKELGEMQQRLNEQGEQTAGERTQEAQRDAQQAAQQMTQAAKDAAKQDGAQASKRGDEAAEQLERAAQTIDQARDAMAEQWQKQVQEQMQQATSEALALAQRQQELLEKLKQAEEQAAQQGQQAPKPPQPDQQQAGQQQQSGQQQSGPPKPGQQQSGQQQSGQQQGQQQSGQQQGQQQAPRGQQQSGQQQGGQQQGQAPAPGGQQPGQQAGGGDMQSLRAEQSALQQSLQQLGRNLQESGESNAMVNREVGNALGRANLSMQQTMEAMQQGQSATQQAQNAVDALNRLALATLNNSQQMQQQGEGSSGAQQTLQQLADIAKQQGSLNGRANSLAPMNVPQNAMAQQLNRLSAEQMEIARRLGNLMQGGKESPLGDLDLLTREAQEIAKQMQTGRLPAETLARQERLFHRLLDAGRSLEKDEIDDERTAERPDHIDPRAAAALDARLFQDPTRFRAPTAEELQALPPAYRRLILDYFARLNRPLPPQEKPPGR